MMFSWQNKDMLFFRQRTEASVALMKSSLDLFRYFDVYLSDFSMFELDFFVFYANIILNKN